MFFVDSNKSVPAYSDRETFLLPSRVVSSKSWREPSPCLQSVYATAAARAGSTSKPGYTDGYIDG